MLTFLIKVPGVKPFKGLFPSAAAAQHHAQLLYPDAPPASVFNLARLKGRQP